MALGLVFLSIAAYHRSVFILGLVLYFGGFNILEAILPSKVSQAAPASSKGAALGLYWSSQYLGLFAGGALGGIVLQYGSAAKILGALATISTLWLIFLVWDKLSSRHGFPKSV